MFRSVRTDPDREDPPMRRFGLRVAVASLIVLSLAAWGVAAAGAAGEKGVFSHPTVVDNTWDPLVPGTQWVFEGRAAHGGQVLPHRLVFTVTSLTKVIDGVRTRVLWDRDFDAGQLAEQELAFHAQDEGGNVWNFGEYPELYTDGALTGAPDTWIAGVAGARKGIQMLGRPRVGSPSYSQGFAPTIGFADRGQVEKTGQRVCVPTGCYNDVLVTREWAVSDPGAFQFKYAAPGVGNVKVTFSGNDPDQEVLVLVKIVQLDERALRGVDREALRIDRRGYKVSRDVYAHTPHATRG
jgi:hypothetical protein